MNPYQAVINKTFDRRIPFTVHWELTYACNLACGHCYAVERCPGEELDLNEVDRVLGELAGLGCLFLAFTGGEIFLRPDIADILALTRHYDFALHLFTNGTLLTPSLLDAVCAARPLGLEISLYSMRPELHDRVVGRAGAHALTLAAMRACLDRGLAVKVKMMVLRCNLDDFSAVRDFAMNAGAQFSFDYMLAPSDKGDDLMERYGLTGADIETLVKRHGRTGRAPAPPPAPDEPLCGAGCNVLCINPRGDVYPCLAIRRPAGNLRRRPLADIWNDSGLDFVRRARHAHVADCRGCADAGYCTRCAGVALAETGDLLAASPSACMAARATRRGMLAGCATCP